MIDSCGTVHTKCVYLDQKLDNRPDSEVEVSGCNGPVIILPSQGGGGLTQGNLTS